MKIALVQLDYHIGNFENNTKKIIQNIRDAKASGAELAVFSELCVCGYPPRDFLEFKDFISRCLKSVEEIATHCEGIAAIIGAPSVNPEARGKDLFNSAYFLSDGKIQKVVHKTLLPNYDIFDEYRYFEPNKTFECIEYKGLRIALTICEDLWNINNNPLYVACPMDMLVKESPDLMINVAASPFDYEHEEIRKKTLQNNAIHYELPLIYVNHVGAQTELIFDGGSLVFASSGELMNELKYFEEDFLIIESGELKKGIIREPVQKIARVHDALVLGIKEYFRKLGFSKAILGLSGGIDSAVVAVLAARALGPENLRCIMLPSKFSSDHSKNDAVKLAESLGCTYDMISIDEAVLSLEHSLKPYFEGLPQNVTEENIQARTRGIILMALSNKFGYILLNTTNKSEASVGYGTLYGDMCGGLAVIADIYKTQVYQLAGFINKNIEIIPANTVSKSPSAELKPNQKDTDSLPEYEILDNLLYQYIEKRNGPEELITMGFEDTLVKRVLKMVNTNEYKRYQTPPILRVSTKAFGSGRRLPIVGKYLS